MQVTDSGGAVLEQDLLVQVTGSNDPPTLITLSAESVTEGLPIGHIVGNLSASDPDPGDSHTFRIAGGRDSKSFSIQSNQLRTAAIFDRETKDTLEVTIRGIDAAKAYTDHTFYLTVDNANDAPTSITLTNHEVSEAQPTGTLVGTLGTTDPDVIPILSLPLHLHLLEKWDVPVSSSTATNYLNEDDLEKELLSAINAIFSTARIEFTLGRIHSEDVSKRFANEAAEQDAINNLVQGNELATTLHGLMDPDLLEPGAFHLYFAPYIGKNTTHHPMKAFHGHAFVGQWTDAQEGDLQKTDLPSAATQALLAVLGAENFNFDTDTIRAIRVQAASSSPVFNPPTAPTMPLRAESGFANISVPDKEYHFDLGGNNVWVPYASNHSISQANTSIQRIILLSQGVDDQLSPVWNTLAQNIADEALTEKTLLVAPQFLRADQLGNSTATGLLHWPSSEAQLYGGLSSLSATQINSNPDSTPAGGKKIDLYHRDSDYPAYPEKGHSELVTEFVEEMKKNPAGFAFLHLTHPDSVGHGHGWGSDNYHNSIRAVDADLALVFDLVENNSKFKDKTVLLLTADHGGGGGRLYEHTTPTHPLNFTIPFYTWGQGVSTGADLYALNASTRTSPDAATNPAYSGESAQQPIRNGDIANLAAKLLGLGPVPGSWINAKQDLSIGSSSDIKHVIAISVDGLRPNDIAELGPSELPQLHRFRNEGAFTDNARTDVFITRTIPNHSSMMTGRGTLDINGVGTGHNQTENHDSGGTLHDNNGSYTHSIFDVAKDGGHRTVLFANKSKFALFERTWDGTWSNRGEDNGTTPQRTSTFAVLDHILDALTNDRNQYPNLEEVVLVGHGDGANLLQRYAASNQFEIDFRKNRKLPVRYVLLAPDNFMFFNRERPTNKGNFAVPDSPPDNFNDYPYGTNYLFEYLNTTGIDNLLDNYPVRDVTYLVGAKGQEYR